MITPSAVSLKYLTKPHFELILSLMGVNFMADKFSATVTQIYYRAQVLGVAL